MTVMCPAHGQLVRNSFFVRQEITQEPETLETAGKRVVSGGVSLETSCYNSWAGSMDTIQWLLNLRETSSISGHMRLSVPSSLIPAAVPMQLLIHFYSPAGSSPVPRGCLFWSELSYCLFPNPIHPMISPFILQASSPVSLPRRLP